MPSWSRSRRTPRHWRASICPTSSTSRAVSPTSPPRRPGAEFEAAAARLDELLPGDGPLAERLERWDRRFEVAIDRLPDVIDALVARFRVRAAGLFGLPDGEDLRVSIVDGQPWSGYNWYDGGLRSRVDINTDLPVRAPDLIATVAHETYPGHHLEHAWKEADLVETQRPAGGVDPAHQYARVPRQRGAGRPRAVVRGPRRR